MSGLFTLESADLERLHFALEASIRVARRSHFFLWTQGALQCFLPHETLLCASSGTEQTPGTQDVFSRLLIPPRVEYILTEPGAPVVGGLRQAWLQAGRAPLVLPAAPLRMAVPELACGGELLCHGIAGHGAAPSTFFVFIGLPAPPGPRERYLAELLMPHLHLALLRMREGEHAAAGASPALLSGRELQVLGCMRDGLTNQQIGEVLKISALTVKNHVQRILRKLRAANRAQAVANGVAAGLIAGVTADRR
ncbi:putative transcriptional activator protein [Azoarcus olearius]|uniref:LuxR C-terminal-related transcriptional regulator n=1 Tax=Azoarcus sp. (strain BH72) TaxID=418699 RepID=UPI0008061C7F|nr:LuxR C-terminal-related transcriptional regulator [Azoarcus olearius]ANQ85249.1 putative transcriptional activator protein [Azoarcus olearius]